ncbi:MAG: ribonuclease HIII [Methanomicrobiaceae archaeon]|nr:ribonuclease HIII [Methanomicrobiaceae archaeon]
MGIYKLIKARLLKEGIYISDPKDISYGIQFRIDFKDKPELFRIYKNKKGDIKYDFSQIKNTPNSDLLTKIINNSGLPEQKSVSKNKKYKSRTDCNDNKNSKEENILKYIEFPVIGTDESGKGDYFGPLVAAGIYVDEDSALFLKNIGVTDSKLLTDSQIKAIAKKIREKCPGSYSIIEISPERYNRLYEQLRCENKNLNSLLAWAHAKAIEDVLAKKECDTAISDQFADERYILGRLQTRGKKIRLIQMHRAERNIAVAAASILARDRFLEKMESLSKDAGIILPKGASHAVIVAGRKIVGEKGRDKLSKYAKIHFKTTGEILK